MMKAVARRIQRAHPPISYHRISTLLVVFAVLLLAGSMHVRYRFYIRDEPFYRQQKQAVKTLDSVLSETRYTLRVFENIRLQLDLYPRMEAEKRENLEKAYREKRQLYVGLLDLLAGTARDEEQAVSRYLDKTLLLPPQSDAQAMSPLIADVLNGVSALQETSRSALPQSDEMDGLSVFPLWPLQENLESGTERLAELANELENLHNSRFYRYIEYSIGLLTLLLILLSFLVRRMLRVGLRVAEASFALLSRHEYDTRKLTQPKAFFQEEERLWRHSMGIIEEQKFLEEVKQAAGRGYVIEEVLENMFRHVRSRIAIDFAELLSIDRKGLHAHQVALADGTGQLEPAHNLTYILTEQHFAHCLEKEREVVVADVAQASLCPRENEKGMEAHNRPAPHRFSHMERLCGDGMRSVMVMPLFLQGFVYAFLVFGSREFGVFDPEAAQLCRNISLELSSLMEKTLLTKTMFSKLATSFAELVDHKDNETGDHLHRMMAYSTLLAKALRNHPDPEYRLNPQVIRDIENNAAIHDIGKVAIPDSILKKPGKLDEEEWRIMRTHAAVGADILKEIREELQVFRQNFYEVAENIARHHHEKWDGTGYPEGLAAHDIPLEARIVAVADVFDALSSPRVYKPAWPMEESFAELQAMAGVHLDPVLVAMFVEAKEEICSILCGPDGHADASC